QLAELASAVLDFRLFADQVMVQMPGQALALAGRRVEKENVLPIIAAGAVNEGMPDDPGLERGEKGLAALADLELLDLVRAEIVQEGCGFWTANLNLPMVAEVEQGSTLVRALVFLLDVAKMTRHLPARLVDKLGAGAGFGFIECCSGRHAATSRALRQDRRLVRSVRFRAHGSSTRAVLLPFARAVCAIV